MRSFETPCDSCLMLPICCHTGVHTGGVSLLATKKCSILYDWMMEEQEKWGGFNLEKFYETYRLMADVTEGKHVQ